jgi:ribonuclease HI
MQTLLLNWHMHSTIRLYNFCYNEGEIGRYRPKERCCVKHISPYACLTIYTDGASCGNPGRAAVGVHIVDEMTKDTVKDFSYKIGNATNNVAGYQAVVNAVKWLIAHKKQLAEQVQLNFCMDSQLVALQLSGQYQIKNAELRQIAGEMRECLCQLPGTYTVGHIPRAENTLADILANLALDKHS